MNVVHNILNGGTIEANSDTVVGELAVAA